MYVHLQQVIDTKVGEYQCYYVPGDDPDCQKAFKKCSIKDHPYNNTQYPALGYGPRGILGSVEFYSRCTNKKPIIHIETVYNDNKDKLTNQIDISDYGGYC